MKQKRLPARGDEMKLRVIEWLDKNQTTKDRWFTVTGVACQIHAAVADTKAAVQEMMSEGWLHVRHEPGRENVLKFRLRREGDQ